MGQWVTKFKVTRTGEFAIATWDDPRKMDVAVLVEMLDKVLRDEWDVTTIANEVEVEMLGSEYEIGDGR